MPPAFRTLPGLKHSQSSSELDDMSDQQQDPQHPPQQTPSIEDNNKSHSQETNGKYKDINTGLAQLVLEPSTNHSNLPADIQVTPASLQNFTVSMTKSPTTTTIASRYSPPASIINEYFTNELEHERVETVRSSMEFEAGTSLRSSNTNTNNNNQHHSNQHHHHLLLHHSHTNSKKSDITTTSKSSLPDDVNMSNNNTSNNEKKDRDRYGFRKKTMSYSQQEYDAWWDKYKIYVQRRKRKWVRLLKENGIYPDDDRPVRFPPRSEKLKRYIRKGIPAEYRGSAWFWYARGHEILNAHPDLYERLSKQTTNLKNNDTELIERDLNRTFPDNIYFRGEDSVSSSSTATSSGNATVSSSVGGGGGGATETPIIQALRRVLRAFSVYQPKIGYCQSLNFIAGVLLLFMEEERAFWMLVIITQRYLPGVHDVNLEGVNIDQGVLVLCVKERMNDMWDKFGVNFDGNHYDNFLARLPPITLCTASWFMSCFINILPTETMLRVWDCFFYEDSKIFFRVALTIIKLAEPDMSTVSDQMEMFQVLQNYPKHLLDPSVLMEQCFKRRNGFGHISQQEIVRLRQFVADRRRTGSESDITDSDAFSKLRPKTPHNIGSQISRRMRASFKRT